MIYQRIAMIAAVILPFFNLPLIFRIIRRRSANDISSFWAIGVWLCLLFMAPAGFVSPDIVWRIFNIINFILFSCVVVIILIFKKGGD